MNAKFTGRSQVRVCNGASCKAWDSKIIIQNLKGQSNLANERIVVTSTKCLNNCGGGVSLQSPLFNKMVKVRNPNEVCAKMSRIIMAREKQPVKIDKLEKELVLTYSKNSERNSKFQ